MDDMIRVSCDGVHLTLRNCINLLILIENGLGLKRAILTSKLTDQQRDNGCT